MPWLCCQTGGYKTVCKDGPIFDVNGDHTVKEIDLSVKIGNVVLKSCYTSGTFRINLVVCEVEKLGPCPQANHQEKPHARIVETVGGMLNSVGYRIRTTTFLGLSSLL